MRSLGVVGFLVGRGRGRRHGHGATGGRRGPIVGTKAIVRIHFQDHHGGRDKRLSAQAEAKAEAQAEAEGKTEVASWR